MYHFSLYFHFVTIESLNLYVKIHIKGGYDLELHLPRFTNNFYWCPFTIIFIIIGYHNIFINWELQLYGFNELEDLGRLLFVLCISLCESSLITVIIWWVIKSLKRILNKSI